MTVRVALAAMVVGLVAGLIARGRFTNLLKLPVRWTPLLALFLAAMIAAHRNVPGAFGLLLVGHAAFAIFAFSNALALRGLLAVGVGLALNFVVMADNHGMPYRPSAVVAAGAVSSKSADLVPATTIGAHPEGPSDELMLFADVIPVSLLREVVSLGDVLIAFGLGLVAFHGMVGDGLRKPRHLAHDGPPATPLDESEPELLVNPESGSRATLVALSPPAPAPSPEPEKVASIWDERIRLLKATGDISVVLDLVDPTDNAVDDDPASFAAHVAVARAMRGLSLPEKTSPPEQPVES